MTQPINVAGNADGSWITIFGPNENARAIEVYIDSTAGAKVEVLVVGFHTADVDTYVLDPAETRLSTGVIRRRLQGQSIQEVRARSLTVGVTVPVYRSVAERD